MSPHLHQEYENKPSSPALFVVLPASALVYPREANTKAAAAAAAALAFLGLFCGQLITDHVWLFGVVGRAVRLVNSITRPAATRAGPCLLTL